MIFPISHEDTELRRFPWVTTLICLVCLGLFAQSWLSARSGGTGVETARAHAIEYLIEHPYLPVDEATQLALFPDLNPAERAHHLKRLADTYPHRVFEFQLEMDQPELGRRTVELNALLAQRPEARFGLSPGVSKPYTWVTHLFATTQPLQLVGLLFFFMAGYALEERWGKPVFLVFFLSAGAAAAYGSLQLAPDTALPIMGMTGATAGVMGAFALRFGLTNMRFGIWLLLVRGSFPAPALLVPAMWAGWELFRLTDIMTAQAVMQTPLPPGAAFGASVAAVLWLTGIEKHVLAPRLDKGVVTEANPAVARALTLQGKGKDEQAFKILHAAARKDPKDAALAYALWESAKDVSRAPDVAGLMDASLRRDIRNRQFDVAFRQAREVSQLAPEHPLDAGALLQLGNGLLAQGKQADAVMAWNLAMPEGTASLPAAVALRLAHACAKADRSLASRVAQAGLRDPALDDLSVKSRLTAIADPAAAQSARLQAQPEQAPVPLESESAAKTPNPIAARPPEIAEAFEPDVVNLAGDAPAEEQLSQAEPEEQDAFEYGVVELGSEDDGGAGFLSDDDLDDEKVEI